MEKLQRRVTAAAEAALAERHYVAPVEVFVALRWIGPSLVTDWRRGLFSPLLRKIPVNPAKVRAVCEHLADWARQRGLTPSETVYLAGTRDRRPLVFADETDEEAERRFRTHWVSPELTENRRQRLQERQSKAPDLAVIDPLNEWTCAGCGTESGGFLFMEDDEPLCLSCADFDHLVFLPSGDAALSRRAKKESTLAVLVLRFNRRRKRYERKGILVEEAALERAEQQCLADEDARARRRERDAVRRSAQDAEFQSAFTTEIRRLFPGCPTERAERIAAHAGLRGSGRVGRSAAGRALGPDAVRLAVIASIRHENTGYDALLMSGVPRTEARERISGDIDRVLARWQR